MTSNRILTASSGVRAVRAMRGAIGVEAGAGAEVGAGMTWTGAWAYTIWL
jgi:hypothetical protein